MLFNHAYIVEKRLRFLALVQPDGGRARLFIYTEVFYSSYWCPLKIWGSELKSGYLFNSNKSNLNLAVPKRILRSLAFNFGTAPFLVKTFLHTFICFGKRSGRKVLPQCSQGTRASSLNFLKASLLNSSKASSMFIFYKPLIATSS